MPNKLLGLRRLTALLERLKRSVDLSSTTLKNVTLENPTATGTITGLSSENTMGDGFVLEDGDGTEITITEDKEVKFVEGTGIDINWTDITPGSDGDPYDLTFTVDLEGTELVSTGETGGTKFLREDGDNTCSWQTPSDTNTMGSGFVLEDGDGTEITITENKEVKFVEGAGIDINWTDVTPGSDADPYDLTFTVNLEGTELASTGESGASKFLREDGDGTCSWQDATAKFILPIVGYSYLTGDDNYYARDPYDARNQTFDHDLGDTIGAESYVVAARGANFVATSACKVTKLRGWCYPSSHTETMEFDIWKATPTNASSATVTYSQIGSATAPSATTANTAYSLSTTYSSGNTLAAGDVLMFTVRKTSGGDGTHYVFFNVNIEIEFT